MKYFYIISFLFSLSLLQTQAQEIINHEPLFDKVEELLPDKPDSVLIRLNQIEHEHSFKEKTEEYAYFLYLKGRALSDKDEIEESDQLFAEARKHTQSEELNAQLCLSEGINSLLREKLLSGSKQLLCATDYFEKFGSERKEELLRCYGNLGFIKQRLGKQDEAYSYFKKALEMTEKDTRPYFAMQVNIGTIYLSQEKYKKANAWHEEMIEPLTKKGYKEYLSALYGNLCLGHLELNEIDKAVFYGRKAVSELPNDTALKILGEAFSKKEQYDSSLVYLLKAENATDAGLRSEILYKIAENYEKLGQNSMANKYLHEKIKVSDSLTKEELEKKIEVALAPYETKKKEEKINKLSEENTVNKQRLKLQRSIMAISLLTFGLLGLLFYNYYRFEKQSQKLKNARTKNKLLRSQLNPHFLFHSLQNIQSFIYQNDKDKSIKYLTSYSRLIRSIFDSSEDDFITIEEDSTAIKNYITLQHLNYNHSFDVDFNVDDNISEYSIPPLIVQPYVENAIIHGLRDKKEGSLSVKYLDQGNKISVIIKDNGKGKFYETDGLKLNKYSSTKVINNRVIQLAKSHNFDLKIDSQKLDNGFEVTITFDKTIKT